jgi:D-glycero-D-manno-heptose 1,7-bisphosphate phosphatase
MTGRPAVFLDRDGVLNRALVRGGKPHPPANASELEILPGVAEACRALRDAGFVRIVVTNQPDVSRGACSREAVEAINCSLREQIDVDDIRVCYHSDEDGCACRKPLPGLLLDAARSWDVDLSESFVVGDRWRDIEAGRAAGCRTILIDYAYAEPLRSEPDWRASSLSEAAEWILGASRSHNHGVTS